MKTLVSSRERAYTGEELRPHFLLSELGLKGTGVAAFTGSCRVRTDALVDWEDRLAQDRIEARRMVHFIGEFFGIPLREGVLLQRLFMAIAFEALVDSLGNPEEKRLRPRRDGDDIFVRDRKLSVSIVTASPVSTLLHAGINIDPVGAPVAAIGLDELGIEPLGWAASVLERFQQEWEGMEWACAKVRPVI